MAPASKSSDVHADIPAPSQPSWIPCLGGLPAPGARVRCFGVDTEQVGDDHGRQVFQGAGGDEQTAHVGGGSPLR